MKHNLSMAFLFGLVGVIGVVIANIGIKQKRTGDVLVGVLITIGSLLVYFLEFF